MSSRDSNPNRNSRRSQRPPTATAFDTGPGHGPPTGLALLPLDAEPMLYSAIEVPRATLSNDSFDSLSEANLTLQYVKPIERRAVLLLPLATDLDRWAQLMQLVTEVRELSIVLC